MTRALRLMASTVLAACLAAGPAAAADTIVGLVTKTNTNPFFVKMREGAEAKAKELGVELRSYAGKYDGDVESQVEAIESLIAAGAKGILITPSDSAAVVPALARARKAGLLVIALDTPLDPASAADATFATDNFKAGQLIGEWAKARLGDKAEDAKIAMLDLNANQISVDVARDQGFLEGFGIDIGNPKQIGDEKDGRIVGHDITQGAEEGGRRAMENLMQRNPSLNLVYTINEPAAAGAYEALRSFGLDSQATIVSIDGGCPGVKNVKAGVIGATSMQFPLRMASLGIEAVVDYARTGARPKPTPGLDFTDTGVQLVTDKPIDGIPSITSEEGLKLCWG
ncbi:fructose transport system substrate-binding protein [Tistlia consotensis]|uniref:Fructose transport system substrate-binding protein n=1 Tax=Tistlia consotensis USBA 355 TaxID=560819 RepID=A0A1Y6BX00_9PROT|nr:sugar ABC transporter substrate-binding protein [Tistlia consotensis]SMF29497.1 fructose transport system substrate-binding protein [Tistlia consotensis USBA 355]SNR91234.1 fructose transport system substrate-binding protein [Tistlia consotensis]